MSGRVVPLVNVSIGVMVTAPTFAARSWTWHLSETNEAIAFRGAAELESLKSGVMSRRIGGISWLWRCACRVLPKICGGVQIDNQIEDVSGGGSTCRNACSLCDDGATDGHDGIDILIES